MRLMVCINCTFASFRNQTLWQGRNYYGEIEAMPQSYSYREPLVRNRKLSVLRAFLTERLGIKKKVKNFDFVLFFTIKYCESLICLQSNFSWKKVIFLCPLFSFKIHCWARRSWEKGMIHYLKIFQRYVMWKI